MSTSATHRALAALVTAGALLFVGVTSTGAASASNPGDVMITADLAFTGPNSAAGTYSASGAINDQGTAAETFRFTGSQVQGTKVLTSAAGTLSIFFDGTVTPTGPTTDAVDGHWVVTGGSGAYAGEHGGGTVTSVVDFGSSTLHSTFTGQVFAAANQS